MRTAISIDVASPFFFAPTFCSWLQRRRGFLAKLARRRLQRFAFRAAHELQIAIDRVVGETNQLPKSFLWAADPDNIIAARRGHQALDSIH